MQIHCTLSFHNISRENMTKHVGDPDIEMPDGSVSL